MAVTRSKTIYSEGSGPLMVSWMSVGGSTFLNLVQAIRVCHPVPVLASTLFVPVNA